MTPVRRAVAAAALALAAAACGRGADAQPRAHAVEIRDFAYDPAVVEAAPGDTVVFTNRDLVPHTATGTEGGWDSGAIAAEASWTLVVPERGGEYACTFHPEMKGAVQVR